MPPQSINHSPAISTNLCQTKDDNENDYQADLRIGRPALTSAQYSEKYHELLDPTSRFDQALSACKTQCVGTNPLAFLLSLIPAISWLPNYRWKVDGVADLVAGFTVAIMHIPQGMAYGMLAGVDPVIGIYTAFFPVLLYVFLGNMPHVSMGTFAVISILVSKPVLKLSDDESVDGEDPSYTPLEVATAVTFCVGIIQTFLGLIRMGSLTVVITDVIVSAFTVGASFHVLTSQVRHVLGMRVPTVSGVGRIVLTYIHIGKNVTEVNLVSLTISLVCLVLLVLADRALAPKMKTYCRFPLPTQLVLVVIFTLLSDYLQLSEEYQVRTIQDIGNIPTGLPVPVLPPTELLPQVFVDSIPVAIVSFVIGQGLGSLFGTKYGYTVPANQEMIAQGASNILGSFFSCIPMSGSLSRSLVQEASGCKSQLTSLVSALLLLSVLLFLGPYFQPLPVCVLAAIILASLIGIVKKLADVRKFWSRSAVDGLVWVVTFLSTVFLDVGLGLITGVACNLLLVLVRANIPTVMVMQKDEEGQVWLDRAKFKVDGKRENLVVNIRGPVNFLTVGLVKIVIENKTNNAIKTKQNVTSIGTVNKGYEDDNASRNEDETIPDKTDQSKIIILDLCGVTSLDSKGCSLVPWLEYKVKGEGGCLRLVAEGNVEKLLVGSGVLKDLGCEVYPTVFDAEELRKTGMNHERNLKAVTKQLSNSI